MIKKNPTCILQTLPTRTKLKEDINLQYEEASHNHKYRPSRHYRSLVVKPSEVMNISTLHYVILIQGLQILPLLIKSEGPISQSKSVLSCKMHSKMVLGDALVLVEYKAKKCLQWTQHIDHATCHLP